MQLSSGDISARELINLFRVERPRMHLKINQANNSFQNIRPNENGMFKYPRDVEVAILVVCK